jgi:hypothetical protein
VGAANLIDCFISEAGFALVDPNPDARFLIKYVGNRTIVVTAEGGDLPFEDDFLVCVYDGDWSKNPDVPELLSLTLADVGDNPASGLSPIDEAHQRALALCEPEMAAC